MRAWYEVRGKEAGSDTVELLYKIPAGQWRPGDEYELRKSLEENGTTDITIARVEK